MTKSKKTAAPAPAQPKAVPEVSDVTSGEPNTTVVDALGAVMQQLTLMNRELLTKSQSPVRIKKTSAPSEAQILLAARRLYAADIRDKTVSWAEDIHTFIVQRITNDLWEIMGKKIPADMLKRVAESHFNTIISEEIRGSYIQRARSEATK